MISLPRFVGTGYGPIEIDPHEIQDGQPPKSRGRQHVQQDGPSGQSPEHHQVDPRGSRQRLEPPLERHAQGRELHVLQLHGILCSICTKLNFTYGYPFCVKIVCRRKSERGNRSWSSDVFRPGRIDARARARVVLRFYYIRDILSINCLLLKYVSHC